MIRYFILGLLLAPLSRPVVAAERPNILWISTEDIGVHLGCYGDPHAITPRLDELARQGWLYENAFTAAPVCSPNRSAIITGIFPTTLGTQHMRSGGEGTHVSRKPILPEGLHCFTEYMRRAGYYCTNNAKQDYNFVTPKAAWDESSNTAHWKGRPDTSQPFFAVFNFTGTHEGSVRADKSKHLRNISALTEDQRQDPTEINPPPYHPNTRLVREQWANYYENITALDYYVGRLLEELHNEGVADNTIVFFWSDHGAGLPRCKRWPYDSGTHVPLVMYVPPEIRKDADFPHPGARIEDLVSSVDLAPTMLRIAGLDIPQAMQGRSILHDPAPTYVFSVRDRMDERYDLVRTVRTATARYTLNYMPWLPYNQFLNTAEKSPVRQELYRGVKEGTLPNTAWWFDAEAKPIDELYVLSDDPHEVKNLADDPLHGVTVKRMSRLLTEVVSQTRDTGMIPEPALWRLEKHHGHRSRIYDAWETSGTATFEELHNLVRSVGRSDPKSRERFLLLTKHELSPFRYWAAIGLCQLGARDKDTKESFRRLLNDPVGEVRIVAAEALVRDDSSNDDALSALIEELGSDEEWVRLHAAIALDRLDEKARPAISKLRRAVMDKENKYVARVANRALNQLEGTSRDVR